MRHVHNRLYTKHVHMVIFVPKNPVKSVENPRKKEAYIRRDLVAYQGPEIALDGWKKTDGKRYCGWHGEHCKRRQD